MEVMVAKKWMRAYRLGLLSMCMLFHARLDEGGGAHRNGDTGQEFPSVALDQHLEDRLGLPH